MYKECERDQERGVCHSCEHGQTYTEHSNGMNRCLPCTHCRPGNDIVTLMANPEHKSEFVSKDGKSEPSRVTF